MRGRFLLVCAGLGAATGCHPGTPGVFEACTFWYECVSGLDVACAGDGGTVRPHELPSSIAVGSRFAVSQSCEGDTGTGVRVLGAVDADGDGEWRVVDGGLLTVTAVTGHGGLVDFAYTRGEPFTAIEARSAPLGTSVEQLEQAVGTRTWVGAVPLSSSGDLLPGTLAYHWISSSPFVLELEEDPEGGVTLLCKAQGEATARVWWGEVSAVVAVTCVGSAGG